MKKSSPNGSMKLFLVTLLLVAAACSAENPAFGYLEKYGIPRAKMIRDAEEAYDKNPESRIVGGFVATEGQFPYQGGLIIDIIGNNHQGVCGATLVSNTQALTAAHCWSDGVNQAWRFEVVLGTVKLFTGGTRVQTSVVVTHPSWLPILVRNDIAVIYLPSPVPSSANIAPIKLPTGPQLDDDYSNDVAVASGYGLTADGGSLTSNQDLSFVNLNVITNSVCTLAFPLFVQPSNICTSGLNGVGTCNGDSGGPLAVTRDGEPLLIGLTSFGSASGCESLFPAVFARVTAFTDFISQHVQ